MSGEYQTSPKNPAQVRRSLWIMWAALLVTHAMQALVLTVAVPTNPPPDPQLAASLLLPLILVAVLCSSMSFFGVERFLLPTANAPMPSAFITPFILKMALAESVSLFGFLQRFLGASWVVYAAFVLPAVLLQLSYAPTDNALDAFERSRRLRQNR
jgi:hypothetical protein